MKQAFLKIIDKEMKEPQHYEVLKYMTDFRLKIEKMDEWIELEEKYPEDNTMVLACYDVHIDVAQWYASEHSWRWIWDSHIPYTHWMPLPPNPSSHV